MPLVTATVEAPLRRTFRVAQLAGMFGETICSDRQRSRRLTCEVPGAGEGWRIGLIVGPSGSGKTTIARAAFGDAVRTHYDWPAGRAVIDGFPNVPTKRIIRTLTAVGFSSPPSWLKPYHVLSRGERFRCDLARALVEEIGGKRSAVRTPKDTALPLTSDLRPLPPGLLVFDEFTSVVDRHAARVTSAAVANQVRRSKPPLKLVAVTCHDDVAEWLAPDWILDMGEPDGDLSGRLSRRLLRRPPIELEIHRAGREAWPTFAPHHYLSGQLHRSAKCYVGIVSISDLSVVGLHRTGKRSTSVAAAAGPASSTAACSITALGGRWCRSNTQAGYSRLPEQEHDARPDQQCRQPRNPEYFHDKDRRRALKKDACREQQAEPGDERGSPPSRGKAAPRQD